MAIIHDSLTHSFWVFWDSQGLAINPYLFIPPKGYTVSLTPLSLPGIATNERRKEAVLCTGYLFFLDYFYRVFQLKLQIQ